MTQVVNFASFKVQKSANERTSLEGMKRGQNFRLKFRKFLSKKDNKQKIETGYTVSDKLFEELNLSEYGIIQLEGTPYLAIVNNDDATMMKRTNKLKGDAEKGKKFKSTILDKALMDSGVIEDKEGASQFLDLVKVADATNLQGDVKAIAIYEIVKGEGKDEEGEDETAQKDNVEESVSEASNEESTQRETVDSTNNTATDSAPAENANNGSSAEDDDF